MAFSTGSTQSSVAQINITPLVDVMLVLLVIFMIAAPVVSYPIRVDLAQQSPPPVAPQTPIALRIEASGEVFWNDTLTPLSALQSMMLAEVSRDPAHPPTLQIDSSPDADYGVMAKVLASAKNADMTRIGFVQR